MCNSPGPPAAKSRLTLWKARRHVQHLHLLLLNLPLLVLILLLQLPHPVLQRLRRARPLRPDLLDEPRELPQLRHRQDLEEKRSAAALDMPSFLSYRRKLQAQQAMYTGMCLRQLLKQSKAHVHCIHCSSHLWHFKVLGASADHLMHAMLVCLEAITLEDGRLQG